ncbi:MAG: glycosyltransferase [Casimicrobium sp.]
MSRGVLEWDAQSPEYLLLRARDGNGHDVTLSREHLAEPLSPSLARGHSLLDLTLVLNLDADALGAMNAALAAPMAPAVEPAEPSAANAIVQTTVLSALRQVALLLRANDLRMCDVAPMSEALRVAVDHFAPFVGLVRESTGGGDVLRAAAADDDRAPDADAGADVAALVSVLIAGHNPRYLNAALQSVEKQTWPNIEIIVCDDNPGAAVADLVHRFAAASRCSVRYFKNETRLGVRRNYERCLRESSGRYVKFLNDDDLLDPPCIERMVRALERCPSAHLVTSHRRRIDERGSPLSDQLATVPITKTDIYVDGLSLINALLMLGLNFVGEPSTAMFRRSAVTGESAEMFHFLGVMGRGIVDMVMWTQLAMRGDVVFLADRLSSFRIHSEQQTATTNVSTLALTAIPALRDRWLAFDFFTRVPPNVLRVMPLDATDGLDAQVTRDWQLLALATFSPPNANAEALRAQWLAKEHPFFAPR